jgi:hypothetical protein
MIDKHIRDLMTLEGFTRQFNLFVSEYNNSNDAYEATERMYEANFGERKYSNYRSFINSRNEKIRNERKKHEE